MSMGVQYPHPIEKDGENMGEKWHTLEEVAELMGVDKRTVNAEIERGNLDAVQVGRQVRITAEAIRDYQKGRSRRAVKCAS